MIWTVNFSRYANGPERDDNNTNTHISVTRYHNHRGSSLNEWYVRSQCLWPTLGPPTKFKHLTRAKEVVITQLRIGHTKATKSHILSRGPPKNCKHCGHQTLTIEHMLLECTVLQQTRDEYYTADSLGTLFEMFPEASIVKFLRNWIILSDMTDHISRPTPDLIQPPSDNILNPN